MTIVKINEGQLKRIVDDGVGANLLTSLEGKYGVQLSDNGKKWFKGLVNGVPFGVTEDMILEKVVFLAMGMKPVAIGKSVGNEWDEMDGILRVIIEKTGYGEEILQRLRNTKNHNEFSITEREWSVLEQKLQYYPNIMNELNRCYQLFTEIAPAIYQRVEFLKNYKGGVPAFEFCFLVGCVREKERAALNVAINKVFFGSGKNLLPMQN